MKRSLHDGADHNSYFISRKKLILFIFGVCLMASSYLILSKPRITQITCQVAHQPCPDQLSQLLQPLIKQSFFFTDLETQLTTLLADQPYQLAAIHKRLLGQLVIQLQPIEPVYNLLLSDQTVAVDARGNLQLNRSFNLPGIKIGPDCPILNQDRQLDSVLHSQILLFWQQLQAEHLTPDEVDCASTNLVLVRLPGQPVFMLDLPHLAEQVQKLIVLNHSLELKTFEPPLHEVDLRFKQPVLR